MKNTLLILSLLFCLNSFLLGQGFNITSAWNHTNLASGVAAGENGDWLVAGYKGDYTVYPYLGSNFGEEIAYLPDYGFLFEEESYGEIMNVSNVVYDTVSNGYYVVFGRDGCDYGMPHQLMMLNEVGFYEYVNIPNSEFVSNYTLDVVPGQGLLIGRNSLWDYSGTSEIIYQSDQTFWTLLYGASNDPVEKVAYWFNNRFIILSQSSLSLASFIPANNGGTILQQIDFEDGKAVAPLNDSTLLVLHNSFLGILDTNLVILDAIEFSDAAHLTIDESYVYVTDADGIHFLNHDLEELAVLAPDELSNYTVLDISARDGRIGLVGASDINDGYNNYSFVKPSSSLFFKTYTINGADLPATTDVAITHVSRTPTNTINSPPCRRVSIDNIEVTVKNEGSTEINDLRFSFTHEGCLSFTCPWWIPKSWVVTSVNLAPGQTTTINIGSLEPSSIPLNVSFDFCLQVDVVEGTTEVNVANNRTCSSSVVVNTAEIIPSTDFMVYPTFCQDQLTLSLPAGTSDYNYAVVRNILGQVLLKHKLSGGLSSTTMDVSQLLSGSYFIRLEGNQPSKALPFFKK